MNFTKVCDTCACMCVSFDLLFCDSVTTATGFNFSTRSSTSKVNFTLGYKDVNLCPWKSWSRRLIFFPSPDLLWVRLKASDLTTEELISSFFLFLSHCSACPILPVFLFLPFVFHFDTRGWCLERAQGRERETLLFLSCQPASSISRKLKWQKCQATNSVFGWWSWLISLFLCSLFIGKSIPSAFFPPAINYPGPGRVKQPKSHTRTLCTFAGRKLREK